MAVVELQRRKSYQSGFHHSETIGDGEDGNTIRIFPTQPDGGVVSCGVIAGSNVGKMQFTLSSDNDVITDNAVWSDWPKGNVTGSEYDALVGPVTGLRGVSITGQIKIEVVV